MGRDKKLVKLSKRLSFLLRHHPEVEDLELDGEGFTRQTVDELAARLNISPGLIRKVVAADPKNRFTIRNNRIRANYGHSVPLGRTMLSGRVPAARSELPGELYHGTAPRSVPSIKEEGLLPQGRQMVHLSTSVEAARRVGARHASHPRILTIDVGRALDAGVKMWKAGPETVLSTEVPPGCIEYNGH